VIHNIIISIKSSSHATEGKERNFAVLRGDAGGGTKGRSIRDFNSIKRLALETFSIRDTMLVNNVFLYALGAGHICIMPCF
jgi:hypothetical protein